MFDYHMTILRGRMLKATFVVAAFLCLPSLVTAQAVSVDSVDIPVGIGAQSEDEIQVEAWEENLVGSSSASTSDAGDVSEPEVAAQPDLTRAILALLAVLAVMVVGAYLLKRIKIGASRFGGGSGVEVLSRSAINSKQSICLVKCGSRLLFVGVSPNHMAALDRVDDPDEVARITGVVGSAASGSITSTFAGLFHRESQEYEQGEQFSVSAEPAESVVPEPSGWDEAQAEVDGLLDKVKGIKRLSLRSRREK